MPTNRFEVTKSGWELYDENNVVVGKGTVSGVDDAHQEAGRAQHAAQYAKIVNKEDVEPVPAPTSTLAETTPSADEDKDTKTTARKK